MNRRLKQQLLAKLGAWNSIEVLACRDAYLGAGDKDVCEFYEIIVNKAHYRVLIEDVESDTVELIAEEIKKRYRAHKYTGLIRIGDL